MPSCSAPASPAPPRYTPRPFSRTTNQSVPDADAKDLMARRTHIRRWNGSESCTRGGRQRLDPLSPRRRSYCATGLFGFPADVVHQTRAAPNGQETFHAILLNARMLIHNPVTGEPGAINGHASIQLHAVPSNDARGILKSHTFRPASARHTYQVRRGAQREDVPWRESMYYAFLISLLKGTTWSCLSVLEHPSSVATLHEPPTMSAIPAHTLNGLPEDDDEDLEAALAAAWMPPLDVPMERTPLPANAAEDLVERVPYNARVCNWQAAVETANSPKLVFSNFIIHDVNAPEISSEDNAVETEDAHKENEEEVEDGEIVDDTPPRDPRIRTRTADPAHPRTGSRNPGRMRWLYRCLDLDAAVR
ncbi:hypothetical protein B0H13DRAFT_1905270 [Mycena leptocephala]|nr:hypothetical protein B0H13DRAFT_1905270 [Mycena leptocephala]